MLDLGTIFPRGRAKKDVVAYKSGHQDLNEWGDLKPAHPHCRWWPGLPGKRASNSSSQSLGEAHLQTFLSSEPPGRGREPDGWRYYLSTLPCLQLTQRWFLSLPVLQEPQGTLRFLLCYIGRLYLYSIWMILRWTSWCFTRHREEGYRSSSGEIFLITEVYQVVFTKSSHLPGRCVGWSDLESPGFTFSHPPALTLSPSPRLWGSLSLGSGWGVIEMSHLELSVRRSLILSALYNSESALTTARYSHSSYGYKNKYWQFVNTSI